MNAAEMLELASRERLLQLSLSYAGRSSTNRTHPILREEYAIVSAALRLAAQAEAPGGDEELQMPPPKREVVAQLEPQRAAEPVAYTPRSKAPNSNGEPIWTETFPAGRPLRLEAWKGYDLMSLYATPQPPPTAQEQALREAIKSGQDVITLSSSTDDDRVLRLHFRHKATIKDRLWLLNAINAKIEADRAALTGSQPDGDAK